MEKRGDVNEWFWFNLVIKISPRHKTITFKITTSGRLIRKLIKRMSGETPFGMNFNKHSSKTKETQKNRPRTVQHAETHVCPLRPCFLRNSFE